MPSDGILELQRSTFQTQYTGFTHIYNTNRVPRASFSAGQQQGGARALGT